MTMPASRLLIGRSFDLKPLQLQVDQSRTTVYVTYNPEFSGEFILPDGSRIDFSIPLSQDETKILTGLIEQVEARWRIQNNL